MAGSDPQLVAAWVSAGAAVVQAFGAVAAIWVSVRLAQQSAEREKRADAEAARRSEEADARAAERIARADKAADERQERLRVEAHNALIERVTSMGVLVAEDAKEAAERAAEEYSGKAMTVIGNLQPRRIAECRDYLVVAKRETGDVALLEGIGLLQDALQLPTLNMLGSEYVTRVREEVDSIFSALHAIEACRQ